MERITVERRNGHTASVRDDVPPLGIMAHPGWPAAILDRRLTDGAAANDLAGLRREFETQGYVILDGLLRAELLDGVVKEVDRLRAYALHHDFTMPGYATPRFMSTVGGVAIRRHSPLLLQLYEHPDVIHLIQGITGRSVFFCTHPQEFIVINYQSGARQTHGWHLDDPDLALILVVRAPRFGSGGHVEIAYPPIPDSAHIENRELSAFVTDATREGRVRKEDLAAGQAYLLNASKHLHRVAPLSDGESRAAINMAYSFSALQQYGQTADILYGDP